MHTARFQVADLQPLGQPTLGLPLTSWLEQALARGSEEREEAGARIVVAGSDAALIPIIDGLRGAVPDWQLDDPAWRDQGIVMLAATSGPVILVSLVDHAGTAGNRLVLNSPYARARDAMGRVYAHLKQSRSERFSLACEACDDEAIIGCLVGLELAAYEFRPLYEDRDPGYPVPGLQHGLDAGVINQAIAVGQAVNVARHLVNLPAADLNPKVYGRLVKRLFAGSATSRVEIWNPKRLREEGLRLMLAVGGAAEHGPRLIRIRYRNAPDTLAPLAVVGKGITFDSGGLDIKPADFMRLMKKDMGGSAAVLGLAVWLERSRAPLNVDLYLAVAENAIAGTAFRPGDVVRAHNGITVEIDNTDAEGRLVLADALSVATGGDPGQRPRTVIDVATLTGAARVALGLQVGALFASDRQLSASLADAGLAAGDPLWPLPLVDAYDKQLKSGFAELVNSPPGRYAGAITAALFLARFTHDIPWAHLDVNAWSDGPNGTQDSAGGNGQAVQCLIRYALNQL